MDLRIGGGFRLCRHVWIRRRSRAVTAAVPRGRQGKSQTTISMLVGLGLAIMWVFLRVCWARAWGVGGRGPAGFAG
jgi:hypothetical protein